MALVETIRGPVDVTGLGTTLMHEHVFVLSEEIRPNYPDYWDGDVRVADAAAVVIRYLPPLPSAQIRSAW